MRCGTNKRNIHPVLSGALVGGLLAASIEVQAAEKHEDPTDDSRGGYTPGIMYRADVLSNVSGGLKRGTRALGNLDATADFDLDRLAGWSGVSAGVHAIWSHGSKPNAHLVGSTQGIDNIEVEANTAKIFQAWIEKQWQDDRYSVRVGLYDLNSEFYVSHSSGIFLHPSPGIGSEMAQTGINGPSVFPTSSLALRLRVRPSDESYLQMALLDGVPGDPDDPRGTHIRFDKGDGTLRVVELGYIPSLAKNAEALGLFPTGKYALGIWSYTSRFADLVDTDTVGDPLMRKGNRGFYVLAERTLHVADSGGHVDAFARYGRANDDLNPLSGYTQLGLVFTGFIGSRPDDQFALSWTHAHTGSKYRMTEPDAGRHETVFEATWRTPVNDWLVVQPNAQYVMHPGADSRLNNAAVLGVRLEAAIGV
jgi:porin